MNIKPEKQFTVNGFPCVIAMDLKGFRRAFVGLPKEHPLFRVAFMDSAIQNINYRFSFSSCKLPMPTTLKTEDETWWLGMSFRFDTEQPFWEEQNLQSGDGILDIPV